MIINIINDVKDKLIEHCNRQIARIEADIAQVKQGKPLTDDTCYPDSTGGLHTPRGDWERGYHKGYERALSQLVELVEAHSHSYVVDDLVRHWAEKLRKEVLDDHS